jgi:hypothetical protein
MCHLRVLNLSFGMFGFMISIPHFGLAGSYYVRSTLITWHYYSKVVVVIYAYSIGKFCITSM